MKNSNSDTESKIALGLAALAFVLACLSLAVQTMTGAFAAVVVTGCVVTLLVSSQWPEVSEQSAQARGSKGGLHPAGTGRLRVSNRGGL